MAQKEFRKPPRYMVGDIVYSHGFICIVCSIYPFNIDYSYDLKVIDGQGLGKICQNDIMHVHIWEEFLKKNGWVKEVMSRGVKNSHWVYTKPDIEEYGYFPIYIEKGIGKEFDVYPFTGNHVCKQIAFIKYVHELQHLLFGLGLNSEMEV